MDIVIGIIAFIFVLGIIVLVHEGGHFLFARKANILCREYAFGMGPLLFSKKKGETFYSVRAFPIGGFCAIAGEELEKDILAGITEVKMEIVDGEIVGFYFDSPKIKFDKPIYKIGEHDIYDENDTGELFVDIIDDENITTRYKVNPKAIVYEGKLSMQIAPHNRTMNAKGKLARTMVIFGGPLFNFILALLVFFIVGLFQGVPNLSSNEVGEVSTGDPLYNAGVVAGDFITSLGSEQTGTKEINSYQDLQDFMATYRENGAMSDISVGYTHEGETKTVMITPQIDIIVAGFSNYVVLEGEETGKYYTDSVRVGVYSSSDTNLMNNSELKTGDTILEISWYEDGDQKTNSVTNWSDVYPIFANYKGASKTEEENFIYLKVLRGEETLDIKVQPYNAEVMDSQTSLLGDKIDPIAIRIGVSPTYRFSFGNAFVVAGKGTLSSFTAVIKTLKMLFTGTASVTNLSGPVGIFSITKEVAETGFINILALIGMLSVNVGLLNLFPIPALDGGRLVFIAFEAITGKKPNQKVETILITVTMLLLFGLIIFVTFGDIARLFGF